MLPTSFTQFLIISFAWWAPDVSSHECIASYCFKFRMTFFPCRICLLYYRVISQLRSGGNSVTLCRWMRHGWAASPSLPLPRHLAANSGAHFLLRFLRLGVFLLNSFLIFLRFLITFWVFWVFLMFVADLVTCHMPRDEIPRDPEVWAKSSVFPAPRITRREGSWTFILWDMYETRMRHVWDMCETCWHVDSCWCYQYYQWKISHVTHVQSLSIPWLEKTLRQGEPMRPVTWAQRTICGFRCQSDSSKSIKTMVSSCFIITQIITKS